MARLLLAFDDVGLAMQLEELLGAVHVLLWQGAHRGGFPVEPCPLCDVAILNADDPQFAGQIESWRHVDPVPALLAVGATRDGGAKALRCQVRYLPVGPSGATEPAGDSAGSRLFVTTIAKIVSLRFACLATPNAKVVAARALGLDPDDAPLADYIRRARRMTEDFVREALRWYTYDYVLADGQVLATLREQRVFTVPENELCPLLDGTRTVRSVVESDGRHKPSEAAVLIWILAAVGGARLSHEPFVPTWPKHRAILDARSHLKALQKRVADDHMTYYELLEVPADATNEAIKEAMRRMSFRYHPSQLEILDLGHLNTVVPKLWQHIEVAYRALVNRSARANYDRWLQGQSHGGSGWAGRTGSIATAEAALAKGQQALLDGDAHTALANIATACRLWPEHPEYEATLAWARYRAFVAKGHDRAKTAREQRREVEILLVGRKPWPRALLAYGLLCSADSDPTAARHALRTALRVAPELAESHPVFQKL